MRQRRALFLVALLIGGSAWPPQLLATTPASASRTGEAAPAGAVAVRVDPRIELISVVQVLSNYFLTAPHDTAYKREVKEHFGAYASHRAVALFRQMNESGFTYDAVPEALLSLTPPPELKVRIPFSSRVVFSAGGEEKLQEFLEALRDFAQVTRFQQFFEAHRESYAAGEGAVGSVVQEHVASLESYLGVPVSNATVILAPLYTGNFAPSLSFGGKGAETYAVIGAVDSADGKAGFGTPGQLAYTIQHEFSHPTVNPLAERHETELEKSAALYPPIETAMKRHGYGNWETAVHEHIIRAIVSRLAALRRGEDAGERILRYEEQNGFRYVRALAEKLKEYEKNRETYGDIGRFFPRLLEVFEAQMNPPAAAPTKQ